MSEITANVNWIAVFAGFAAAYGLGWLWYGPLFGKTWSEGLGLKLSDMTGMPVAAMAMQAVGTFLLAWVFGVTAGNNALLTVILVVLAIAALIWGGGLYAQKPGKVIAIEVGYVFAMAIVMFLAQAIF
jgi:Protein of unknown function (DUF1761)